MNEVPGFDADSLRTTAELQEQEMEQVRQDQNAYLQQNNPQLEQEIEQGTRPGPPASANTAEPEEQPKQGEQPQEVQDEAELTAARRAQEEEAVVPKGFAPDTPFFNDLREKFSGKKDVKDFDAADNYNAFGQEVAVGVAKGLHSLATSPERLKDMLDGSYDKQVEEKGYYEPTGTYNLIPGLEYLGGEVNPDLQRTKWGEMVAEVTKTAVIGGAIYATGGAAGLPMSTAAGTIGTATLEGLLDEDSAKRDTLTTQITNTIPFLRNSTAGALLSNGEDDTALVRTLRNTFENIGMAGFGDAIARSFGNRFLGKGAVSRGQQVQAKALQQLDADYAKMGFDSSFVPEFGGYKNKPLADPWQGNAFSQGSVSERLTQAKQKAANPRGSTASSIAPDEITSIIHNDKNLDIMLNRTTKELLGDDGIAKLLRDNPTQDPQEMFRYAYERQQAVVNRNLDGISAEEFWAPLQTVDVDGVETLLAKEIVAADLVNAELFSQVRDTAVGMREIQDFADLSDVDGPLKTLMDRLKVGLGNVERTRALHKAISDGTYEKWIKNSGEFLEQSQASINFRVDAITNVMNKGATDAQVRSFAEVVSGLDDIHSFGDLDEYFKFKLKNKQDGLVFEELGGVYVNSVLSGPRTPMKAIFGTASAAYIDSVEGIVGSALPAMFGNVRAQRTLRASLGSVNAMNQALGESFDIFRRNVGAYLRQDVAAVSSRFPYKTAQKKQWEAFGAWINTSENATYGDKAAFAIMDAGYKLNNSSMFTYANSIMTASDDAWRPLMARYRARNRAWRAAIDDEAADALTDSVPEVMMRYDKRFYDELLDSNGRIDFSKDAVLESMYQRATLTEPLQGFNKDLDEVMGRYPLTRPMYMFARTGVNDLRYQVRKMPVLGQLFDKDRAIFNATYDNLDSVAKFGIKTAGDLEQAKFEMAGRIAIGTAVTFGGVQAYQQSRLTGDGPMDPQIRQAWIDAGWEPNKVSIPLPGGMEMKLGLEQLGGFGLMLRNIANVGDNIELMGEKWGENNWATIAHAVGQTATDKFAMSNLADFADIFNNPQRFLERGIGQIANNQVPLAGLRNQLGQVLVPGQAEVDSGIVDSIRNRNKSTELLAGEQALPPKWDLLEHRPLKNWNFWQRALDAVNPVGLSIDKQASLGRKLIYNSNYDLSVKFYRYKGVDMSEDKYARNAFNEAFSKQNVIQELDVLASDPAIQASVAIMKKDAKGPEGSRLNPMTYLHNQRIKAIMDKAKDRAWLSIQTDPEIIRLQAVKEEQDRLNYRKKQETKNLVYEAESVLEQTPYK